MLLIYFLFVIGKAKKRKEIKITFIWFSLMFYPLKKIANILKLY